MSQLIKKYKCTLKRELLELLKQYIEAIIENTQQANDDDKMHSALLAEISDKIYNKLGRFQTEYQISFTAAQALALRILYTDYITEPTSYLGNKMHEIAMGVHKQYY